MNWDKVLYNKNQFCDTHNGRYMVGRTTKYSREWFLKLNGSNLGRFKSEDEAKAFAENHLNQKEM